MDIRSLKRMSGKLEAAIESGEVMDAYQAEAEFGYHHNNYLLALRKGKLEGVKVGKTWYTTRDAIKRWRDSLAFQKPPKK